MININNPLGLADLIVWVVGSIFVCYGLSKRYSWAVPLVFGVTVFSALRIYRNSLNGFSSDPVIQQFDAAAQSALLTFLLTVMIVQALSIQSWLKIFKAVAVTNALVICGDSLFFTIKGLLNHLPLSELRQHEPWGILLNASMSGCLNASIFPLFNSKDKIFRYLILVSIFAAGRSLPVAVLFVGIGALLFAQKRYRALHWAIPISFIVGFLVKGRGLFESRGRDYIWTQAYYFFRDHLRWSIGSGLGGFYVIGPVLTNKEQGTTFIWLHSDWLQTLFEQGIIGFVIILGMYLQGLRLARVTPQLFSALVAYAAFAAANMPLRYPLAGIYGAFLMRWAMEKSALKTPLTEY